MFWRGLRPGENIYEYNPRKKAITICKKPPSVRVPGRSTTIAGTNARIIRVLGVAKKKKKKEEEARLRRWSRRPVYRLSRSLGGPLCAALKSVFVCLCGGKCADNHRWSVQHRLPVPCGLSCVLCVGRCRCLRLWGCVFFSFCFHRYFRLSLAYSRHSVVTPISSRLPYAYWLSFLPVCLVCLSSVCLFSSL